MADWYGKSTDQILDWLGQGKKTIFGDPEAIKASYDQAINASREQGQQIRDFLMGREAKAQSYFDPFSAMLMKTYGTQGIHAPVSPGAEGVNPLSSLYGGK